MKAEFIETGGIELQTYPQYIFRTNKPVKIQMLPPLLQTVPYTSYVASGEFDTPSPQLEQRMRLKRNVQSP